MIMDTEGVVYDAREFGLSDPPFPPPVSIGIQSIEEFDAIRGRGNTGQSQGGWESLEEFQQRTSAIASGTDYGTGLDRAIQDRQNSTHEWPPYAPYPPRVGTALEHYEAAVPSTPTLPLPYGMQLMEERVVGFFAITRVPGGWLFRSFHSSQPSVTFVPYSDDLLPQR